MSGWDVLDNALQSGYAGSAIKVPKAPKFGLSSFDPSVAYRAPAASWGQIATAGLGAYRSKPAPPAGPPEKFDFGLPLADQPPSAPKSNPNILDAFGDALGNLGVQGGIMGLPAWLIERPFVLGKNLADGLQSTGIPGVQQVGQVSGSAIDAFTNGVKAVSDTVGPILQKLPNWDRDQNLDYRARVYRALVLGQDPSKIGFSPTDLLIGGGDAFAAATSSGDKWQQLVNLYQGARKSPVSPHELAQMIDLPEDVLAKIRANPDGDINRFLDESASGRQYSYRKGLMTTIENAVTPGLWYGAEALTAGRLGAAIGAAAPVAPITVGGNLGRVLSPLGKTLTVGGESATRVGLSAPFTLWGNVMKAGLATGLGIATPKIMLDTLARFQGNQSAIDTFDAWNRTQPLSLDANFQLVSSFSTDIVGAVKLAKAGTLRLGGGIGDIAVGKPLGRQAARLVDVPAQLNRVIGAMYRVSPPEAADIIARHYGGPGPAIEDVYRTALDIVADDMPKAQRAHFQALHGDPREATAAALQQFAPQIRAVIDKRLGEMATRFNTGNWQYHGFEGPFDPEIAATTATAYRGAMADTWERRAQVGAVVGYTELIPPVGQDILKSRIETATAQGPASLHDFNALVRDFPALRRYKEGLIPPGNAPIPRASLDTMLERAQRDYASTYNGNPVRATQGHDPVLRPDSPTPNRDLQDALGVDEATANALTSAKSAPHDSDVLSAYLRDKAGLTQAEVAGLSAEELRQRAVTHMTSVTEPWRQAGQRIVDAEKRLASLRSERAKLGHTPAERYDATRLDMEERALQGLLADARSGGTFAEAATRAQGLETKLDTAAERARIERATRVVEAQRKLDQLSAIEQAVKPAADAVGLDPVGLLSAVNRGPGGDWVFGAAIAHTMPDDVQELLGQMFGHIGQAARRGGPLGGRAFDFSTATPEQLVRAWREFPNLRKTVMEGLRADQNVPETAQRAIDYLEALPAGAGAEGLAGMDLPQAAEAMGAPTVDALVERLGNYRAARDAVLDPALTPRQAIARVRTTANLKVPAGYVEAIGAKVTPLVVDPAGELAHLDHIEAVRLAIDNGHPEVASSIIETDPRLLAAVETAAEKRGIHPLELLDDPTNAQVLRDTVVPAGWQPRLPGAEETPLDMAITGADHATVASMVEELSQGLYEPPPALATGITDEAASEALAPKARQTAEYKALSARIRDAESSIGKGAPVRETRAAIRSMRAERAGVAKWEDGPPSVPPSVDFRKEILARGGDLSLAPAARILEDPRNATGLRVLSLLNHGTLDTMPETLGTTAELLSNIEKGLATKLGIGTDMQAQAQRVATDILERGKIEASEHGFAAGVMTTGIHPSMFSVDELAVLRDLMGGDRPVIAFDGENINSLTYGFKKPPTDAILTEWAAVPGMAEEMFTKQFQPFEERIGTARIRQAYNYVFGKHSNRQVQAEFAGRFGTEAGAAGVDQSTAAAIWDAWRDASGKSRFGAQKRIDSEGNVSTLPGEKRLYGTARNIPNGDLQRIAEQTLAERASRAGQKGGAVDPATAAVYRQVQFDALFRRAAEPAIVRAIADHVPLGTLLERSYGTVSGLPWVSTIYHFFRFASDLRMAAYNLLDGPLLYFGRAGLKGNTADEALLGSTEAWSRRMADNPSANTDYSVARDRGGYLYRAFLKEQPETLRGAVGGILAEPGGPAVMAKALDSMVRVDPELRDMQTLMESTPGEILKAWTPAMADRMVKAADGYFTKVLRTGSDEEVGAMLQGEINPEIATHPEMAEVLGRLMQVNQEHLANVRETFFGNPDRSRAERVLNSYLLYWPLSYQIKATKWMAGILFDRAGGLKTNAGGAWLMSDMVQKHNELLAADPEYRAWYEKHKTLVFLAGMLMPITPDHFGVTLNPIVRNLFFSGHKAITDIGPVYTAKVLKQAAGELYPDLAGVPGAEFLYKSLTGFVPKPPPKPYVPTP